MMKSITSHHRAPGNISPILPYTIDLYNKIKFTLEVDESCSINFLNVTIIIIGGKHNFKVFRKPTYTEQVIIDNQSFHPLKHKLVVFHTFSNRTVSLSHREMNFEED